MRLQSSRCLLLNADFSPLSIIEWKKAVIWHMRYEYNSKYYYSNDNNLEKKFKSRADTYKPLFTQYSSGSGKSFMNRTNANDIFLIKQDQKPLQI